MSFIRSKHVKIRTTQKCWGCDERFLKGATLLSATYRDDNGIYSLLLCEVCEEYDRKNLLPRSGVDGRSDFKNHDPEGWWRVRLGMGKCLWKEEDQRFEERAGDWETSCNHLFYFTEGTPSDNEFKYCPYCSKTIDSVEYVSDVEDD